MLAIISIVVFSAVQQLKNHHFKESIIKEINSVRGSRYTISNNVRRYVNNRYVALDSGNLQDRYKLVCEMNFDCSMCLEELNKIYQFYLELLSNRDIEFCLITAEKSHSYVEFFVNNSLKDCDFWVIQQELKNDNIKLYLLDDLNNIVMAGDIAKYPFLKDEYIRKIESRGR